MGGEEGVVGAPGAPWDQKESGGGTGADSGFVYGETGIVTGAETAANDVRAATVGGQFGWRTGLGAVAGGAEAVAEKWRGWVDVAAAAERWQEGAGACEAAGEDG